MDLVTLWVLLKTRRETVATILLGAILFLAGWHGGRITSPYYTAHQIVFEDNECGENIAGGSKEGLVDLQQQGIELADKDKKPPLPSVATKEVKAATTVASPPSAVTAKQANMLFVASKNSDLYHYTECSTWQRIKPENQVWFSSREEAASAGYLPSKCTIEKLGQ